MAVGGTKVNPKKFHKNQIPLYLYLIPIAIFMGAPIVYIINHAFKPMEELFAFPPTFFVKNPTLDNFTKLLKFSRSAGIPLSRYVFNSLLVTVLTVGLSLLLTTCAAFAFSKIKFKGRNLMLQINQIAIMFVATAVLIPRYLVISNLGLIDTVFGHVLPLVAMPVALFLVKQFVDQVPDSLIEAAQLEGAGSFKIYRKIIIPLIKPAIATGAILVFQNVWNNIETSSLFTSSEGVRTLAFYMNTLSTAGTVQGQGMAAAAALIMFIPNLLLFIVMQSSVMNTMAHSGLK
jgi:ABC-type glycerol-3-phosphate transport system permease component